jgi:hypothetical protein
LIQRPGRRTVDRLGTLPDLREPVGGEQVGAQFAAELAAAVARSER